MSPQPSHTEELETLLDQLLFGEMTAEADGAAGELG